MAHWTGELPKVNHLARQSVVGEFVLFPELDVHLAVAIDEYVVPAFGDLHLKIGPLHYRDRHHSDASSNFESMDMP